MPDPATVAADSPTPPVVMQSPVPSVATDAAAVAEVLPPPLPYIDPRPPRRSYGVYWALAAFVTVAATLGVIGSAVVRMGPSTAAAGATSAAAAAPQVSVIAPDPLASVGESARPVASFDRATAALRAAQAQATEPTRRWAASGAFNLSAVKSAADLDRRIEVLEALGKATRDARLAGDAVLQKLRGDLAAAGAGAVQQELWVAQWAAGVKFEDDRQVALAVEKFLAAGRTQLKFLRQEWGRWYLDRSTDKIQFADPDLQNRFARQAAHVGTTEAELNEAVAKAKANAGK